MPNVARLHLVKKSRQRPCGYLRLPASRFLRQFLLCLGAICLPSRPLPAAADEYQVKVLNNFVTQLIDLGDQQLTGKREVAFMNPRPGWCWFALTGAARVRLNSEGGPFAPGKAVGKSAEGMRWLPAGQQTLHIEGRLTSLNVRNIPALQYAFYGRGNQWRLAHAPCDWEFLTREVLPHVNVLISAGP